MKLLGPPPDSHKPPSHTNFTRPHQVSLISYHPCTLSHMFVLLIFTATCYSYWYYFQWFIRSITLANAGERLRITPKDRPGSWLDPGFPARPLARHSAPFPARLPTRPLTRFLIWLLVKLLVLLSTHFSILINSLIVGQTFGLDLSVAPAWFRAGPWID